MFDHFRYLAPIYDRVIRFKDDGSLSRQLDLPINGWLLDAGGGTGRLAGSIVGSTGHLVVTDISRSMLLEAQKKGLSLVETPTEALPFADGIFERVLIVDAFHHVMDQKKTAMELWRILAPGGRMVIVEPDIRKLAVKMIALLEKIALMRSHFLSPENISILFAHPNAQVSTDLIASNAWISVRKVEIVI